MTEEVKQDAQETDGEPPKPDPTFTQADIDRIVKERLERVKAKYADYDDLKSKAMKLDELERAKMDEQQRLAADLKAPEDWAAAAEKARDEALAQSQERLIRAEVTAQAAAMGFKYPGDIHRLADLSATAVKDSGAVVGVKEALEALARGAARLHRQGDSPQVRRRSERAGRRQPTQANACAGASGQDAGRLF